MSILTKFLRLTHLDTDKSFDVDTSNKKIGLKLSETSGNLIQQYDDGLYYGIEAPASTKNLYVDPDIGIDQNPDEVDGAGTRAKPLKTIQYAISLGTAGTTRSIHLAEGKTHILDADNITSTNGGIINIAPYGNVVDTQTSYDVIGYPMTANKAVFETGTTIKRKFKMSYVSSNNIYDVKGAGLSDNLGTSFVFLGLTLDATLPTISEIETMKNELNVTSSTTSIVTSYTGFIRSGNVATKCRFYNCEFKSDNASLNYSTSTIYPYILDGNGYTFSLVLDTSTCEDNNVKLANISTTGSVIQKYNSVLKGNRTLAITEDTAKTRITNVSANEYAFTNFSTKLSPSWWA